MTYQIDQIKSTLEGPTVATAAGVGSMVGRVFLRIGELDMTSGMSIGRLPIIQLKQVSVDYDFDAEPYHRGSRTSDYIMRIMVPTFVNRSDSQYRLLEKIKTVSLSAITKNLSLGLTNVREEQPEVTQMVTAVDIRFTTNTSYDYGYGEGN